MNRVSQRLENGKLAIITGFDGACPFSATGVSVLPDDSFEVRPSWRKSPGISEEAPGCGNRFSIKVENSDNTHKVFRCFINWEDHTQKRLNLHDWACVLFPGAGEAWQIFPTQLRPSGANLEISLPPGITHIAMSPYYSYGMCVEYLKSKAEKPGAKYFSIGSSQETREIPALILQPASSTKQIQDIMIMARNHAYESAGNFCCEGMIDFLTSTIFRAKELRKKYRFHFLPMTNPDGVHNGMCRLTAPQGADLNRCREQDDDAWRSIKNYLDEVKPELFINIHNWLYKDTDGLLGNSREFTEKFAQLMPDMYHEGKHWYKEWIELFLEKQNLESVSDKTRSWKDYVLDNFNATAACLEFPWFGRSCQRMREIGRQSLTTFIDVCDLIN